MIDQQFAGAKEQEDQAKALKEQYEGALKSGTEKSPARLWSRPEKKPKHRQTIRAVEDTAGKGSCKCIAKCTGGPLTMSARMTMRQMKDA